MSTTDNLEIVRNLLGLGIVAANIGVWRGVYLENEHNDSWTKETGWILLVRSLAAEALFAFALLSVDFAISQRQKTEIISLETYLLPRVLTDQQNASLAEKLASPFKVEYAFAAVNEEEANLAIALSTNVFSKLGWQWVDWPGSPGQTGTWLPYAKKLVGNIMLSGIQIRVFNSRLSNLAMSLVASLKESGLEGVRIDSADGPGTPNAPMLIEIMIGQKPRYIPPK